MKNYKWPYILLFTVLICSCKKSENSPTPQSTSVLQAGNLIRPIVTIYSGTIPWGSNPNNRIFYMPCGLAVDDSENVYVSDLGCCIKKINSWGIVNKVTDSSITAYAITFDRYGFLYVPDSNTINKISPTGAVTQIICKDPTANSNPVFKSPYGIAVDSIGNIYVADKLENVIKKVSPSGNVTILAGSGVAGYANGTGTAASFNEPTGLCLDNSGNILVTDVKNGLLRKITLSGVVSTIPIIDKNGYRIFIDNGIAVDKHGNIYSVCSDLNTIYKITTDGRLLSLYLSPNPGYSIGLIGSIAISKSGNIYISEIYNYNILKVENF